MIKLGDVILQHGLMLAPMAGFSDYAMRVVCHSLGAEYSVTEMVSAKAVVYGDKKTARLARITKDEGPVGLQLFGSEPAVMAEAAGILSSAIDGGEPPVAIDVNMGCPVPKIFGNGEGSALMKSPALIYDIVKAMTAATRLPITVKMRLGVDRGHISLHECARAAEEGGAKLLTVHGRTRAEMYMGRASFEEMADVKKDLHIPLVANGDVASGADALRVLSLTGADGLMIGRGAVGNPFIFAEIKCALEGKEFLPPTRCRRAEIALLQLSHAVEEKGEHCAVLEARKQVALYFKGFKGAAELRASINRAESFEEVARAFAEMTDGDE